jgi:hypothetical protein
MSETKSIPIILGVTQDETKLINTANNEETVVMIHDTRHDMNG